MSDQTVDTRQRASELSQSFLRKTHTCLSSQTQSNFHFFTSNMTGRHWVPKRKLRAGYRALSLQCTSYFSASSVVSRAFSALYVYSTLEHHPHPVDYLCAKFRFSVDPRCWASQRRKVAYSINQSITQHIWCAWNRNFRWGKTNRLELCTSDNTDRSGTSVYYAII